MLWDDILTKANAAWLAVAALLAGAVKLLVNTRSQLSDLSGKLAKDRAGEQLLGTETALQIGWLKGLVQQNERNQLEIQELRKRLEDYGETRLNDARALERRDAEVVACKERAQEMKVERDIAVEDLVKSREDVAALKEHIVVLDGQMLAARVANVRLFAAMPDGLRQDMAELLLKQEPSKP